jgi:hypothetical protein
MKTYESLYKRHKQQEPQSAFAHFYAVQKDYDEPYKLVARQTMEGIDAWAFQQDKFKNKYPNTAVPKLKNYLNYTFKRLIDLENNEPGRYFVTSKDGEWIAFNTGLQNIHGADLLAIFERYKQRPGIEPRPVPDWVFKGCYAPNDRHYRDRFATDVPDIAWYSVDSRDFVFDIQYRLERDGFDHLFERAKERAGLPSATDEAIRNYLRGALENLVPKIRRNYKVAIPVWYVEERRMQLLLPFYSANSTDVSCFLVDRDDPTRSYRLKTIFDLDQAYFSARLITRPDKDWLNP